MKAIPLKTIHLKETITTQWGDTTQSFSVGHNIDTLTLVGDAIVMEKGNKHEALPFIATARVQPLPNVKPEDWLARYEPPKPKRGRPKAA